MFKNLFNPDRQAYFKRYVDFIRSQNLYPPFYKVNGPSTSPIVSIEGKKYLTFCSNNYLGIANHPRVNKAAVDGIETYGVGSGSTRLLSGSLEIQTEFEDKLADFFKFEDSITFSSGYLANIGTIRMLIDPFPYMQIFPERGGLILSDEYNHASIIDSVRLAKAQREVYKHNDLDHLETLLKKHKGKRKLIITDGVFSMDGDLANLPRITQLAEEYKALVFVDDSHAVGVLGPGGEGTAMHQGVHDKIDVLMGSFTKAFGSIGGFVGVSDTIADYLRITARSYIFSDPIPPAIVRSLLEVLSVMEDEPERRTHVLALADSLRKRLKDMGFTVLGEETPIVPILVGEEKKCMALSDELYKQGILAPCVRRPAVAVGKERIRLSVMGNHEEEHIDTLLNTLEPTAKKLGII